MSPPGALRSSVLLLVAIAAGALTGHVSATTAHWLNGLIDPTLLCLVSLLFLNVRLDALLQAAGHWRIIGLVAGVNFLLVPLIGYGVATMLLPEQPMVMLGLMIYFMSPCTDWFLGFTRLAGGNVALGTALIPVNMVLQLLLYPLYLHLFTQQAVQVAPGMLTETLTQWFVLPLLAAITLQLLARRLLPPARVDALLHGADQLTPWVLAVLVLEVFAANIRVILSHGPAFGIVLLAVFIFFALSFVAGEIISRMCRLHHPEHALLTMSIAARNAPLMLAVTMTALPGQVLVHAAVVIGMLLEFPHLMLLRTLLLRKPAQAQAVIHHKRQVC